MNRADVPADGLAFPRELTDWRAWQERTHALRRVRTRVTSLARGAVGVTADRPHPLHLAVRGSAPMVLLAVDATTPTQIASILRPLRFLDGMDVAIVSVADLRDALSTPGEDTSGWTHIRVDGQGPLPERLSGVRVAAGVGHYLAAGSAAYRWSRATDARFVVIQHGLLTPYAPPLPDGAHLAAFTPEDARFYASGRDDVSWHAVGSQLLWEASRSERHVAPHAPLRPPVFLGQLHGAELPRAEFARAATQFWRATGGVYRPHPGERDRVSRAQHALWRARGLSVDTAASPLTGLNAPVASVFSTGVLEAAARGLPARVTHPDPPAWLLGFWERYGMVRWDGTARGAGACDVAPATSAPAVPDREPSRAVADLLRSTAGDHRPAAPSPEDENR